MRAVDIATEIVPAYQRDADRRNFENQVYSVIKRRPDLFRRQGKKGQWALTSGAAASITAGAPAAGG